MPVEMEAIDSSLISHRGHSSDDHILHIRFRTKTGVPGSLYEYANVSPALYAEGLAYINDKGDASFGQWFNRTVKIDPKRHPFRKLEEVGGVAVDDTLDKAKATAQAYIDSTPTTDFASGQPIPAITTEPEILIPEDAEALKTAALQLKEKASAIIINSAEACELAMKTGMAIARMRDALDKTFRPGIQVKHQAWKAELAILNHYDQPLESDQNRLRDGIIKFRQEQQRIADAESRRLREEQQRVAEAEANQRAQELKLADAIEAEQRGEPELAQSIIEAPALPLQPAYVPPVYVPTNVPTVKGASHREKWIYEWVDKDGNPIQHPDMSLIPMEYHLPDDKAIGAIASRLKTRTNIPGVRVYDAGNVSFSKK